jgi:predicted nucleotidyltransferase
MQGVLEAVAEACRGVEELQAALVFGSVLERDNPGDLDIAFLWTENLDGEERWRRANRIAADLEHRLAHLGLNVDLKDLRTIPLVLQHRILRDGRVAYVADRRALIRFNAETVPRALDFLPFHRRMLRASARRLAGDGR